MANVVDENNLLVFDPSSASVIFTVGEGLLTKSKKIVASLTQALILFSDKVVNQEISFIRFQNHRMVFIHEKDLYGVKLVPKDQLTKNFVPAIKIILNIQSQLRKMDSNIKELSNNTIASFYNLIKNPDKNLYLFQESIEGYLGLLTFMAALNYDLSTNLESIKANFLILKEGDKSFINNIDLEKYKGIISFGANQKDLPINFDKLEFVQIDLKDSIFNNVFPNNKSLFKLISQIIGNESSSYIISQIINRETSINEVALSLIKLPDTQIAIEIAIEAITNFSKEQRLAKPLYRTIIKKLKDLEGTIESDVLNDLTSSTETKKEERSSQQEQSIPVTIEPVSQIHAEKETTAPVASVTQASQSGFSPSDLSSLANEFTSKLETLTQDEENLTSFSSQEEGETLSKSPQMPDSSLVQDKNHIFLEYFRVYFDFAPFRLGIDPENISYRPSVQLVRIDNDTTQFNIKIDPERQTWFWDICKTLSEEIDMVFKGENGNFQIEALNSYLVDIIRVITWSSIIDLLYNIQNGEVDLPDIFNITNKSNLCIVLELTPERRKQLPSQIEVIVEEDKLISGPGPEDQIKSFDKILMELSTALKTKKGVGLVLRKNSKELPLVLEFVLSISEMCGIGWSRW